MSDAEMTNREVVVTGVGLVSSLGDDKDIFWKNILAGKSGITEVSCFDTSDFDVHRGGEVKDFNPDKYKINQNQTGRCSQFAVAATQNALNDADLTNLECSKIAVVIGTTMGESQVLERIDELWLKNENTISSELIQKYPTNNIAECITKFFKLRGCSIVIPTACAAGNYCVGYALDLIQSGDYDVVIAGGAESMSKIAFTGFSRIFAVAPEKCQPFDKNRKGIMVGEGAGILVLESREHAKKRKAKVYCKVLGYGLSTDAKHMTIPNEEGVAMAMRRAITRSRVDGSDIDYISAHGTGTPANDVTECTAINRVFGDHTDKISVSSIKSMLGHTMGAASAIEAISCVLSIQTGFIPPTINLEEQDPGCRIDCVPNHARQKKVRIALNNAFAFGGNNSCVVFAGE